MKNISKFMILSFLVVLAVGCKQDFLDVEAMDSIEETSFWESETQARSYMFNLYMYMFPGYSAPSTVASPYDGGQFLIRYQTLDRVKYNAAFNDDWAMVEQFNFDADPAQTSGNWSNFYGKIRLANYAIANAHRLPSNAKHWEGVARFFRAAYYADMVFLYGDVPYFDEKDGLADANAMDVFCKKRTSRVEIDKELMNDFKFAMEACAENDGYCQVNKYVAAAMASRMMLREGTFLKYHKIDEAMAATCIQFAKDAALFVMNSGVYAISDDYNALFTSDNLSANKEVIMARAFESGQTTHATLSVCFKYGAISEDQNAASKSLAEAFLGKDGMPIATNYSAGATLAKSAEEFFANRDPRLALTIRPRFSFAGTDQTPFLTKASGFVYNKFFDDRWVADGKDLTSTIYSGASNITDAPCIRLAEVMLNYIEAAYELQLMGKYTMTQEDLDKTINAIRDRKGVEMPHVTLVGNALQVNGKDIVDPKREKIEAADMANGGTYAADAILWEIRRERRTEMAFEGFRFNDLKRWGKLNYAYDKVNPDICFGAYLDKTAYAAILDGKDFGDASTYAGLDYSNYIKVSKVIRNQPDKKFYLTPIPSDQIVFYKNHNYELTQNPGF